MDAATIGAGAALITGLADLVDRFASTRSKREAEAIRLELLERLVAAKNAYLKLEEEASTLRNEKVALEEEVSRLKAFEAEEERYQLKALGDDAFVYVRKEAAAPDEPAPRLCVHCFQNKQRSVLQRKDEKGMLRVLVCHACGARVQYRDPRDKFRSYTVVNRRRGGPGGLG